MLGWEKKRSSAEGRPRIYQPGNNAKVLPEFKKSAQETQLVNSFLIDHPCPEKALPVDENLRKQIEKFIKVLELLSSKSSAEDISFKESNLMTIVNHNIAALGFSLTDAWAAIEKDTGSWKKARVKDESYPAAYKALAKLLSMKVIRQH